MSDDILSVSTPFPDVASLAQGYINRVDGERLLVPLEVECEAGAGIRFVVYLGDGTAAFAGAGRCAQVSDQGTGVPPEHRYETLIDALDLDERSRPVYDYIVAVRNAAYGQDAAAEAPAEDEVAAEVDEPIATEAVVEEASLEAEISVPSMAMEESEVAVEPGGDALEELPEPMSEEAVSAATEYASMRPDAHSSPTYSPAPPAPGSLPPISAPPPQTLSVPSIPASFRPEATSFIPPALPTGILQRPPRALHWQPAPPRRPTPLPQTGLFRYTGPGLPVPSAAPRPDLDPARLVRRAPRP